MGEFICRSAFYLSFALVGGELSTSRPGRFTTGNKTPVSREIEGMDANMARGSSTDICHTRMPSKVKATGAGPRQFYTRVSARYLLVISILSMAQDQHVTTSRLTDFVESCNKVYDD